MQMPNTTSRFTVSGKVRLLDANTGRVLAETGNMVVDSGLNLIASIIAGTQATPYYIAIGTDGTAVQPSDQTLYAEHHREQVASATTGPLLGQVNISAFFLATDANVHIREVGLFGGSGASNPNGGTMIARTTIDYDNSVGAVNITVEWVLTFSR